MGRLFVILRICGIMFFTVIDRKVRTDEIHMPFEFIAMAYCSWRENIYYE